MEEDKLVKCDMCGKEVPDWQLDREGQCQKCRAEDRASDMTVGDLGGK